MRKTAIFLLGAGIHSALHLTIETIQALRLSKCVFVLHDDPHVIRQIAAYSSQVVDLVTLYEEGDRRSDIYKKISKLIVEAAQVNPPVAFVVHGHPLFLVSATEYTLELAASKSLPTTVLPGISSFDTIMCDLRVDYAYSLQMFDATVLLERQYTLNSEIPLLIFQLATVLEDRVVMREITADALVPLVSFLFRFYPEDHIVTLLHSSSHLLEPREQVEIPLRTITSDERVALWKRPTLYVPAVNPDSR